MFQSTNLEMIEKKCIKNVKYILMYNLMKNNNVSSNNKVPLFFFF